MAESALRELPEARNLALERRNARRARIGMGEYIAPENNKTIGQVGADWLMGTALGTALVPGVGDVAGLAADAAMYAAYPEQRNWLNYGLTGLGTLPFIPAASVMGWNIRQVRKTKEMLKAEKELAKRGVPTGSIPDAPAQGQSALRGVFSTTDRNAAGMTPNMVDYQTAAILERQPNYFKEWKDVDYQILNMSPDKYINRAADILASEGVTAQSVIAQRARNTDYINKMAESMRQGKVYAAPYLDYGSGGYGRSSQEGFHRALAAKQLGMEEIPVMVMDSYSNPRSPIKSALRDLNKR